MTKCECSVWNRYQLHSVRCDQPAEGVTYDGRLGCKMHIDQEFQNALPLSEKCKKLSAKLGVGVCPVVGYRGTSKTHVQISLVDFQRLLKQEKAKL